jgi:hypothetical protein
LAQLLPLTHGLRNAIKGEYDKGLPLL